jgi:lysophospholipase L1-like esterase
MKPLKFRLRPTFENVSIPIVVTAAVVLLINCEQAAAMGRPKPSSTEPNYLMAALGDSISAGTLADTSVHVSSASQEDLQNSYTGVDQSKFIYTNRYDLAWGTGDQIPSHYMQLKSWLAKNEPGMNLVPLNLAIPGAVASQLVGEAQSVVAAMATGQYRALKYVTLDIGANDACAVSATDPIGTPDDKFADSLRKFFATLAQIKQDQPIRVMVSSIPKVPDLGRPDIQETATLGGASCNWIRAHIFTYCRTLPIWTTEAEYENNVAIVEDKNAILQSVIDEVNKTYTNVQASFSYATYNETLVPNMLAVDCFHPNKDGQTILSEKLWADQPWFR